MKKNNLYFYCSFSAMYETLHGMYNGGINEDSFECTTFIAEDESRTIIENYGCIIEAIHDEVNEQLGYDDTPDDPDDEYLDALEDAIEQEISYVIYKVTEEGENHLDEMEEDPSGYEWYLKNGWLVDPTA